MIQFDQQATLNGMILLQHFEGYKEAPIHKVLHAQSVHTKKEGEREKRLKVSELLKINQKIH